MDDLLFRIGVYRDSDQPAKTMDNERDAPDAPDYMIIRVDGGATGLLNLRRGMRLRIHGFLQSADFRESLEEFLEKSNKYSGSSVTVEVKDTKPNQTVRAGLIGEVFVDKALGSFPGSFFVTEALARTALVCRS